MIQQKVQNIYQWYVVLKKERGRAGYQNVSRTLLPFLLFLLALNLKGLYFKSRQMLACDEEVAFITHLLLKSYVR